jgi:hypothetical protein
VVSEQGLLSGQQADPPPRGEGWKFLLALPSIVAAREKAPAIAEAFADRWTLNPEPRT